MQRINSIQNFKQVLPSHAVTFEVAEEHQRDQGRRIRLRVNAPEDVVLYTTRLPEQVDPETGETLGRHFLATVKGGFDEIEFVYTGDFALHASGEVWLDTYEGSSFVVESSDLETYARVFQRPEEDPRVAEFRAMQRQIDRERRYQRELDRIEFEERMAAALEQVKTNVATTANPAPAPAPDAPTGVAPVGPSGDQSPAGPAAGPTVGEPNGGN